MKILILSILFILFPIGAILTAGHFYTKFKKQIKNKVLYNTPLLSDQMMVPTSWTKSQIDAAVESINIAKDIQKPRTIKIIGNNDEQKQKTPRKTRRIRKRPNTRIKKGSKKTKSNNKVSRKGPRL